MAFSFRMGTKRCHDFPKLARESGFYFNMHRSRVRVDWNRISNIDVDRIIRDRDFHAIDDNINIVIDYCLESEYDVKILDPSFVKLFRLAQLAVEYLLYCKQYLDHSVMILKDELRSKIEENVKLKKETGTLEEVVNHLKEKAKDRSKLMESKIGDCNGEIYKCPHCPKTFISSMFVSAHIIRRHGYMSDLCATSSSIHEHYQNETKKLHNEIKSLKERLNETERVIRNESERISEKKTVAYDKRHLENEAESFKCDTNKSEEHPEYKGYQEEIKNLKTMLFDEIHHLRQKEKNMCERMPETNVQTLINQQEKEFQKLRNQLFEKLTPDIEGVQAKLYTQENYWRSKIERIEEQHQKDVERLSAELKLTQKAADDIKAEYEFKVNDLERQTANQSNILKEQSRQLKSLSHEINVSQLNERNKNLENDVQNKSDRSTMIDESKKNVRKSNECDLKQKDYVDTSSQMIVEDMNSILSSDLSVSKVLRTTVSRNVHTLNPRYKTVTCEEKKNVKQESKVVKSKKNVEKDLKHCSLNDTSESQNSRPEKRVNQETKHDPNDHVISKADLNESKDTFDRNMHQKFLSMDSSKESEALEDDLNSEINSEPSMSESQTQSETESFTILHNNSPMHKHKKHAAVLPKSKKTAPHDSSHKKLRENLLLTFEQKLRDLGIDPEWQGIPKATFKQKMDILRHHEKITTRKLPKYHQAKLKIIEELLNKISKKGKTMGNFKPVKRLMPMKAFGDLKAPANSISQDATPKKLHSTSKVDCSVKSTSESELTPIKSTKTSNHKSIESLIQISPSLLTSVKKDSLNRVKSLFDDSANNTNEPQELQNISMSPKHNKSALKTAIGSTSSLTKKKVIFDLADENDRESLPDYDVRKDELHSVSAYEQSHLPEQENYKNTGNIVLKTSQSDKIAEISKKLEAQLSMVRQKPVGSIETIFSSKYMQNREDHNTNNQRKTSTSISSLLESPFKPSAFSSEVTKNQTPQPAPRNLKDKTPESSHTESISEISDLDSDIDKILKLE